MTKVECNAPCVLNDNGFCTLNKIDITGYDGYTEPYNHFQWTWLCEEFVQR